MDAPPCAKCGGTRWVRYFSETIDGNFEEAFRLCECNYELEGYGEGLGERLEYIEIGLTTGRLRPVAHSVTLEISVELDPSGETATYQ